MNPDRPPEELQARRTSGKEKVAHWGFTQAGGRFASLRAAVIERVLETVGVMLCRRVVMAAEPLSLQSFFKTLIKKMLMRARTSQDLIHPTALNSSPQSNTSSHLNERTHRSSVSPRTTRLPQRTSARRTGSLLYAHILVRFRKPTW